MKTAQLTINQAYMENFFRKNLKKFFPVAQKLEKLEIRRHQSIAPEDFIVRYKIVFKNKRNQNETQFTMGIARDDGSKYQSYKAIKILWKKGFSFGQYLIPRPLNYSFYLNQFLYEEVPGQTLYTFIAKKKNLKSVLKRSAQWLARLHGLKIKRGIKSYSLGNEKKQIQEIKKLFREMVLYYKPFREDFSQILNKLWEEEKKYLHPKDFILIHNDFNPGNIILEREKIASIDFVLSLRFHPLIDVVALMTYLDSPISPLISRYKFKPKVTDELKKIFLKEYCRRAKINPQKIKREISLLEARSVLVMAMNILKLALAWRKKNKYKWRLGPISWYDCYRNPRIIEIILKKADNYLKEYDQSKKIT
jgi:thiamine kinase-like enzyme